MLNYYEYDDDLLLFQKIYQLNEYDTNNELLLWFCMTFFSFIFTTSLWLYVYNYIVSGRFAEVHNRKKQKVFIVRRLPSQKLDQSIVDYIKENANRPYKVLSTKTYDNKLNHLDDRVFLRFMKKLYKTDYDIYVMNTNLYRSSYDNYIYYSEVMGVEYEILDFVRSTEVESNYSFERRILDRETRDRITIELD